VVELDGKSFKLLKKFYDSKSFLKLSEDNEALYCLLVNKFVYRECVDTSSYGEPIYSDRYSIDKSGKLAFRQNLSRKREKWTPLIISYLLSAIALAVALFKN